MANIYISSTYGDLADHRRAVAEILRKLGHTAVAMEDYTALWYTTYGEKGGDWGGPPSPKTPLTLLIR